MSRQGRGTVGADDGVPEMNKPLRREPGFEYMGFDDFSELLADKPEDETWELINGRVIRAQVGARIEHHHIIDNIGVALSNHLRATNRPCRVYRETFFLKSRNDDLAALPDLMVRCGTSTPGVTSFNDPIVLIEVVSPGSQHRDRLEERIAYQALASLQSYVIVERDRMLIDIYGRGPEGFVNGTVHQKPGDLLRLSPLSFEVPLSEVYRDVELPHS